MNGYIEYQDSINILKESENPSGHELNRIVTVLEDADSPLCREFVQLMLESIYDRPSDISTDIRAIHKSCGDVDQFQGIRISEQVCIDMKNMAIKSRNKQIINMCDCILELIGNLRQNRDLYQKGYVTRCNYVVTEYAVLVAFSVEFTSCLIASYVDVSTGKITLTSIPQNGTARALLHMTEQAKKYNKIFSDPRHNHRNMLESMINRETDKFIGSSTAIGIGVVTAAALSVVPLTRELVYQYYKIKSNLSDCCAQQAYFLELNKSAVENNSTFNAKKRAEILKKQEQTRKALLDLSSKLRVDHIRATSQKEQMLKKDNQMLTLDNIQQEINQAPLELF